MKAAVIKNIAKWVWISAVLIFSSLYTIVKWDMIVQAFSMLSTATLLLAGTMILSAKLCLVYNMRSAALKFNIIFSWWDCYCIYNFTQLAKYIPGSIWQFVGRITILHERGTQPKAIRDSLLAENFWVVAAALLLSMVFVSASIRAFIENRLLNGRYATIFPWLLFVLIIICVILLIYVLRHRNVSKWIVQMLPPLKSFLTLCVAWMLLGVSLWITILPYSQSDPSILFVTGVYCFSFLSGFIVPFSPAGLGIREMVLMFCLSPIIQSDVAFFLAAVNRIVYFLVEVLLVSPCIPLSTRNRHCKTNS